MKFKMSRTSLFVVGALVAGNSSSYASVHTSGIPTAAAAAAAERAKTTIAAAATDLLWLPLGDSITFGCTGPTIQDCHNDGGGYRVPLAYMLSQPPLGYPTQSLPGYNVSTCGTLTTGPSYVPAQWQRHEGHPGIQINGLDGIVNASFATCPREPDLVTILLGTNDCNGGVDPTVAMPARMDSLLGHIRQLAPAAQVFLADVPATGAAFNDCVTTYSRLVPGIVAKWQAAGMNVTFAPLNEPASAGSLGVCSNGSFAAGVCGAHEVHPTTAGYPRLAAAFAASVMQHLKL
jgi:lysophospholipase L1-like esterase